MENSTMLTKKVMEDLKTNDTGRENITEGMGIKNPLLINLVVSSVLKNLDIEDLKNCRLVNEIWKIESTPILKNKSVVRFRSGKSCAKYLEEMIHFEHSNFDIPALDVEIEVRNFFRCLGNQIKSLRLTVKVENPSYLQTIKEITESISNLENLVMDLSFFYGKTEFDQGYQSTFLNIKSLDKVQKLTLISEIVLQGGSDINTVPIPTYKEMAEFIVKLVPKPESLVLHTYSWLNDEIFEKYTNSHDVKEVTISDITMHVEKNHLEVLSKWPDSLKKLKLNLRLKNLAVNDDLKHFQALLNRHCPTLQELKIYQLYFTKSIQITMPKFPKLRKLNITMNDNNGAGKIDFQFDSDLKDHFPRLKMEEDKIIKMFAQLRA